MPSNEPMIKLDPHGKPPILSYNVPEPTSYVGKNFIELHFDDNDDLFKPEFKKLPETPQTPAPMDTSSVRSTVVRSMKTGFADSKIFSGNVSNLLMLKTTGKETEEKMELKPSVAVSARLATLNVDEVTTMKQSGYLLKFKRLLDGTLDYKYIPEPKQLDIKPRFYVVETYGLSSFLGSYGAGRVIKTFSLLPGEKTRISVKSYLKRTVDAKSASSILDSVTEESAREFENSLEEEQSDKEAYSKTSEYYAEAEASGSWGVGSASAKAGFKSSSSSSREEFSKNVSKATEKHAAKASAKRDVQINTSYEVKEESGEETSTEREIQNINLSRTLNFVFRQMNQEFITLLHLMDIRIAFFNGHPASRREVPISQLRALLDEVMVDDNIKKDAVQTTIMNDVLDVVFDYQENPHQVTEEKSLSATEKYIRFKKDTISTYKDSITDAEFSVEGIITAVTKNVLRTEGVIVEAMLGEGIALDSYATQLQDLEVVRRQAETDRLKSNAQAVQLVNDLVSANDTDKAKLLIDLIKPCCNGETTKPA